MAINLIPLLLGAGTFVKAVSDAKAGNAQAAAQAQATLDQAMSQRDEASTVRDEAALVRESRFPVLADAEASFFNATIAEQNAILTRASAAELERRTRVQGQKGLASIRTSYAASGLALSGSAKDVLAESAVNAEMDALLVRHQGLLEARALDQEATLARFRGEQGVRAARGIEQRADSLLSRADRMDAAAGRIAGTAAPLARNIRSAAYGNAAASLLGGLAGAMKAGAVPATTTIGSSAGSSWWGLNQKMRRTG